MLLSEAAEIARVPYRTAARWIEEGLVQADGYTGIRRVPIPITDKVVGELRVLGKLREVLPMQADSPAAGTPDRCS